MRRFILFVFGGLILWTAASIAPRPLLGQPGGDGPDCARQLFPVRAACVELSRIVMAYAANGRFAEAEKALSMALAARVDRNADPCAGVVLGNMAALMSFSGRLVEAEKFALRSIAILEKLYPPDDAVLLRPLHVLAASHFDQGNKAKAREAIKRIQLIRAEGPEDSAMVHVMTAALLSGVARRSDAETEYRAALTAFEEAGRGYSADVGSVLTALAALYLVEERFDEARQTLDRALANLTRAQDAAPMDHFKLLYVRGVLHERQKEWAKAAQDLYDALTVADRERVDPVMLRPLLIHYAEALRKDHRPQEARAIEARAVALRNEGTADAVVDVTELLPKAKPMRK